MVTPVILALDYAELESAQRMARLTAPYVAGFKVGLELLMAVGPVAIEAIRDTGVEVFADAKLHDIPNTVGGAAEALGRRGARWVTVHGSGGRTMIESAIQGLRRGREDAGVLVVTVLTSLDAETLGETGVVPDIESQVGRLTRLADVTGAEGVICPPSQPPTVKALAPRLTVVTPGIRGSGTHHDQRQVATARGALDAGADLIVVGRAVTAARDPVGALNDLMDAK
ncbi:MAG: orotidine-5'-phosphate decarboxylase [Actinobacteria bacterium]|nr:orotidine-5'-phosphate decarboxylase [Actinomycetota bacterium]